MLKAEFINQKIKKEKGQNGVPLRIDETTRS